MSMQRKETVVCSKCGKEMDLILWESLSDDINPEAKQQLLDGTLFRFTCSNCGEECKVDYEMVYQDTAHEAIVCYVDESDVEETQKMMDDTEKRLGFEASEYRNRIVTSQNALREKAFIFEYGLDDRVIEIIKFVYFSKAREQFPDANITDVFFLVENGKYILSFISDRPLNSEISVDLYDDVKGRFAERLAAEANKERIVDMKWAEKFLKG